MAEVFLYAKIYKNLRSFYKPYEKLRAKQILSKVVAWSGNKMIRQHVAQRHLVGDMKC